MPIFKVEFRDYWLIQAGSEQEAKEKAAVLLAEATHTSDAFTARQIDEDDPDYDEDLIISPQS